MGLTEAIFLGAAHLSVVEWVCFEHLHGEVVPMKAEAAGCGGSLQALGAWRMLSFPDIPAPFSVK